MKIINEEWKTIERTNGNYEISNLGRVKSKERIYLSGENYRIKKKTGGKLLNPTINKDGYPTVSLRLDDGKRHSLKVHRLVALAFIQNPENLPQINHKDENKENNCVDNLEWCDAAYNNCYGTRLERVVKSKINGKNSYPVIQKIDNKVIETFPSLREVQRRTGYNKSLISKCCKGIYKQAYGYNWEFVSK